MRSTIADIAAIRPKSLVHPESWHCQVAQANTVMVVITGSRPLGVATETSDWDETAVFVEEPRHIFSLDGQIDVHKDAVGHDGKVYGVNHRMSAGDYERVSYSLRHYLRLLCKGNPNVLQTLYSPDDCAEISHPIMEELRDVRDEFFTRDAVGAFFGICNGELTRLMGERSRKANRPDLIEKFGYDTKSASHIIRNAHAGITLIEEGHMDIPIRPEVAEHIVAVRNGAYTFDEIVEEAKSWLRRLEEARDRHRDRLESKRVDRERWSRWLWESHRRWWAECGGHL